MNWLRKQLKELIAMLFMMVGISPPEQAREQLNPPKTKDKEKP